jgi:UDP-N-acetylglucosamine--N-acetylmuramyl-(pentapeptide) pyrophosphoryl-undecaprenol N-acetylglucosamine transferase
MNNQEAKIPKPQSLKILFTGGGTAGHLTPIIAICRQLKKMYQGSFPLEFYYLGPRDEFSKDLVKEGIRKKWVASGKIRRYLGVMSFFQNLIDLFFKIPFGIFQAFLYIFAWSPDLIFSKGGYGSIPTVIAGWLLRTPIFLHESDFRAGVANRFIARFASLIFISFPETGDFPLEKTIPVGNPIREEILKGEKKKAKEMFNLSGEKPVILILGGSQGAQRINEKILEILPELLKDFEVLHQSGKKNFREVEKETKVIISKDLERFYHLFPFFEEEELTQAYAGADLIVSRAGSGTIFEILALGKPSILIPLPEAAQGHQLENAYFLVRNRAAIVIEEVNFRPHFFLERLRTLFSYPEELEIMARNAKSLSRPEAAKLIAHYIIKFLAR